jgi:hypothetical protein
MDIEQRFLAKVNKTDTCWLWTGSTNGVGYGEMRIAYKKMYAHRWSFEFYNQTKIPAKHQIDHLCRNRGCVNPKHLEAVTQRVNIQRGETAQPKPYMVKEYCSNGHPYAENSYVRKDGKGRNCIACVRNRSREYQRRKRLYP